MLFSQAATAAGREILEVGTALSVYWPGSDAWFTTRILGHYATLEKGRLKFKHRCEYSGGSVEHDLGQVEFERLDDQQRQEQAALEQLENADVNSLGDTTG